MPALKKKSSKIVSYLNNLKFESGLLRSIQARYLSNFRFPVLIIIAILLLGVTSFIQIPRRLNPEIKIPIINVSTVLPGANPEDVEQLLTIPIEDELEDIKGLDTMSSVSVENVSAITLQFVSTIDPDKARSDVRAAVDSVPNLPEEATDTNVALLDFEDQPVWTFSVYTDKSEASLMRFSKILKETIESASKVDRVVTSGIEDQYIEVSIDPSKIESYGINPIVLSQLVKRATAAYPAGTIETERNQFSFSINPQVKSIEDVRNLRILLSGQQVRLSDIAVISEKSKKHQNVAFFADSTVKPIQSVQFYVYKTSGSNIDAAEKEAHVLVDETIESYGDQFKIKTVSNTATEITKQFDDLFAEFGSTIALVFILLFLFLGLRQAFIASLTIPLTFLSAFAIISSLGMTLNFLTLFAFLLSLGLLIDDTIVVVAAMTRYYRTGNFTPMQTGILVWRDFIVPLWSTTITTIWAFVPLLLSTGIIGEFIKPIPIVVTATMLSSTSIAVLITIPLMIVVLKPDLPRRVMVLLKILGFIGAIVLAFILSPKGGMMPFVLVSWLLVFYIVIRERKALFERFARLKVGQIKIKSLMSKLQEVSQHGVFNIERLSVMYLRIIRNILESKKSRRSVIIGIVVFVIVAYALVPFGFVKNEFFPKTNEDILYVNVDLPQGTGQIVTFLEAEKLGNRLRKTKYVDFVTVETGQKFAADAGRTSGDNLFVVTLHLVPAHDRDMSSQEISEKLREELKGFQAGVVTVTELSGGPPSGADVQIKLTGQDLNVLNVYADKIVSFLKKQSGIVNPDKSYQSGTGKLVFVPDNDKMLSAGITVDSLGLWLRTYASGFELDKLKVGQDEKVISMRFSADASPDNLYALQIPSQDGYVPLVSLGNIVVQNNPTQITREDGDRTISVFAGVASGHTISDKNKDLLKFVETLELPSGYAWKTGGVNEENNKSVQSIMRAMVLSILLILITMIIEFRSFRQAFIALLVIPISVAGVLYIFGLFGIPLSFPALIGVLALFGIVVTHAIVVIEKINDNIKEGLELKDAIVDAAANRLEPVLLTSLATIVGLVPITYSDPLWRGLGGAIIAGLLFSGAIKLFLVPVLYFEFFKTEK